MPATEQTWRNQKVLHVIFGVISLVLLIATLWMLLADSNREWKGYQKQARNNELALNSYRTQQAEIEAKQYGVQLQAAVLTVRSQPVDAASLENFVAEWASVNAPDWEPGSEEGSVPTEVATIRQKAEAQAEAAEEAAPLRTAAIEATQAAQEAREAVVQLHTSGEGGMDAATEEFIAKEKAAKQADTVATEAEEASAALREDLLSYLTGLIDHASFREKSLLTRLKFRRADYDAARANVDLAIRDGLSAEAMAERQAVAEEVRSGEGGVEPLNSQHQAASAHRKSLQEIFDDITKAQDEAQAELDANQAEQVRLASIYTDQRATYFTAGFPFLGKKWLELPILDAFGSPLTIDNLWTEGLTINNNFTDVRRFDRCTTCHQAIEKSAPGNPLEAGFTPEQEFELLLLTPEMKPLPELDDNGNELPLALNDVYGMRLADAGIMNSKDVTIAIVLPDSLAAKAIVLGEFEPGTAPQAGLMSADVILAVDGNPIQEKDQFRRYLLSSVEWGKPLRITVRRGFPNPYTTHPRLDLYASSMSPHPISVFACTICHGGQGSATTFDWSSHTPNTQEQRNEWVSEHGWFDNHHWIYPMHADRFMESTCLKCHHEVVDLMPSEQFPDSPAPKVVHGYELIRENGCFGCHEINGYDGPDKRIGPDMRVEPNYFAAAQQLWADPNYLAWMEVDLTRENTVNEVVYNPANPAARHELLELLVEDSEAEQPMLSPTSHRMAELLHDVDTPGELRRVGPSLRYIDSKLGPEFIADWLREPANFRPDTRMPQFFGLLDHMRDEINERAQTAAKQLAATAPADAASMKQLATAVAQGDTSLETRTELRGLVIERAEEIKANNPQQAANLKSLAAELVDDAERYEPVEIMGIVEYLTARSQEFEYAEHPAGIDAGSREDQIDRGKVAFEMRGCLACHQHNDFPQVTATQGPNLSRIADKLALSEEGEGADWLYTWLLDPSNYHVRTKMPDLYLEPITETGEEDNQTTTDPAADIAAYLLADVTGWEPAAVTLANMTVDSAALNDLTLENLSAAFYEETAREYLETGIPEDQRDSLKGAEVELILAEGVDELTDQQKLVYIGRRSIMKYGCSGCHDIPGFEDAKPIGTSLADWGKKEASRLAFEHVIEYVEHGHAGHGGGGHMAAHGAGGHGEAAEGDTAQAEEAGHGREPLPPFYLMHLESHDRIGFIFQKLREPRSYDFRKNRNRHFNERLRMPEFNFNNEEREAVVTFVLGLVAEPPAEQFVYTPDPRQQAIIDGRHVLEKYNCAGCHMLEAEQWDIAYQPGSIEALPLPDTFPFILPQPTEAEIHASIEPDRQGLLHATLTGMPRIDMQGHPEVLIYSPDDEAYLTLDEMGIELDELDDQSEELAYSIELWEPVVLEGQIFPVKGTLPPISEQMLLRRREAQGGDLTHLLVPRVIEMAGLDKGAEAYGWLPPPLMGEGSKVQSDWLHDFLLDPYRIRPAVVLRMPRFNMSSEEATALAAYFAAIDNEQYPYELPQQRRPAHLAQSEEAYQVHLAELGESGTRYGHTMEIVTDAAGCVKCHYVGDFSPGGSPFALAPDLSEVYNRLQPEYLRRWIAKPDWVLPYTPMPENIPYQPGTGFTRTVIDAEGGSTAELIYHGDSTAQLDALVDLLSNFDRYAREQTSITPLVQQAAPPEAAGEEGAGDTPTGSGDSAANEPAPAGEGDAASAISLEPIER